MSAEIYSAMTREAERVVYETWCFPRNSESTLLVKRLAGFAQARLEAHINGAPTYVDPSDVPIPLILTCPGCNARHIDEGEFATRPHCTHACQSCGLVWKPALVPTVGVRFLPGFKNVEPVGVTAKCASKAGCDAQSTTSSRFCEDHTCSEPSCHTWRDPSLSRYCWTHSRRSITETNL